MPHAYSLDLRERLIDGGQMGAAQARDRQRCGKADARSSAGQAFAVQGSASPAGCREADLTLRQIGEHLVSPVPHGHWKTLTFIAALRNDRIATPWVIDGPDLPHLSPPLPGTDTEPWRHRGDGQPACSQGQRRLRHPQEIRHPALLSAALLTGSEPDRKRLRQAENADTKRRRANHPRSAKQHWQSAR